MVFTLAPLSISKSATLSNLHPQNNIIFHISCLEVDQKKDLINKPIESCPDQWTVQKHEKIRHNIKKSYLTCPQNY